MSLIICPECQKEVSDKAHACPFCGFPNPGAVNDTMVDEESYDEDIHLPTAIKVIYALFWTFGIIGSMGNRKYLSTGLAALQLLYGSLCIMNPQPRFIRELTHKFRIIAAILLLIIYECVFALLKM